MFLRFAKTTLIIILSTVTIWVVLDQLLRFIYPDSLIYTHYSKEQEQRIPAPYIGFIGKPNSLDHNDYGYRYQIKPENPRALKIAFYGGSTGYGGEPPIASLLEKDLSQSLGRPVSIANFSITSSNHRQHLHNLIETRKIFEPDIVLFYGGYNETAQQGTYDPRPGFPYNFYYRDEMKPSLQWLLSISPTLSILDWVGVHQEWFSITPLHQLRMQMHVYSKAWADSIVGKYFETLDLAKNVSSGFTSKYCGGAVQFRYVYQPYRVPENMKYIHQEIQKNIALSKNGYDLSGAYQELGPQIYTDIVHVKQAANEVMAQKISQALLNDTSLKKCLQN